MSTESILATLLAASAFLKKSAQETIANAVKDAYEATKAYLRTRLGETSEAMKALELATGKPDSIARKTVLHEETESLGLETDVELRQLVERLAALLPRFSVQLSLNVHVGGDGNKVQVAGRDLVIKTEKHFRRNVITPDERHLTDQQRERIHSVIAELAERLAVGDSGPNFAAVHRMIQRHYGIASYLLIRREKFEDVMSFLSQQRAIHRSRLRRHNPVAYQNDFFRSIFAGAGELGWDRYQVYEFAFEKLGVKNQVTSLKQLGPSQLKSLADFVRSEVRKSRKTSHVTLPQTGRVGKGLGPFSNRDAGGD